MDNGAYSQDPEKGTELNLVDKNTALKSSPDGHKHHNLSNQKHKHQQSGESDTDQNSKSVNSDHSIPGASNGVGQSPDPGPSTSCKPEVCQRARERYTAPDLRGSPWHRSKTIFLLTTIGLLILWAIIYSTLSKFDIV